MNNQKSTLQTYCSPKTGIIQLAALRDFLQSSSTTDGGLEPFGNITDYDW